MSRWIALVVLFGAFAIIAFSVSGPIRNCCGARPEPSATEAKLARSLRALSIPGKARDAKNPFAPTPEILQEAGRHFADHCSSCHANDGSGITEMGRNLYPRSPDMRQAATQQLADGELYSIIHNGVRWTGMPAWGSTDNDSDSWKLVLFIRHLPSLTPAEQHDMEQHNPQSPAEIEEQQREEKFLNGETK